MLNAATHKMFQVLQTPETYRVSPSMVTVSCGHPPQIVKTCCKSVVPRRVQTVKSRHRDRSGPTDALAAKTMREDNPIASNNNQTGGNAYAKQS
jgi:hypothetical protein